MSKIKLLACDPALRNWGLAKMEIDTETLEVELLDLKLIHTESDAGKTVRKSSDDLRRALEAWEAASDWAEWADLIAAEIPTGSQSSRASFGAGVSVGLLAALGTLKPLLQMNPTEVKKTVTGRKNATKDELIQWAMQRWPRGKWLTRKLKGAMVPVDANEHLADACAIGVTATSTVEFKAAVKMLNVLRSSSNLSFSEIASHIS